MLKSHLQIQVSLTINGGCQNQHSRLELSENCDFSLVIYGFFMFVCQNRE